jgi:hypothetical protein
MFPINEEYVIISLVINFVYDVNGKGTGCNTINNIEGTIIFPPSIKRR